MRTAPLRSRSFVIVTDITDKQFFNLPSLVISKYGTPKLKKAYGEFIIAQYSVILRPHCASGGIVSFQ